MTGDLRLIQPYAMAVTAMPTWDEYLRTARMAKGWTQEDLAGRSGVSVTTVINQESPTKRQIPTPDNLRSECAALGLDLRDALRVIYQLDDAPPPPPLPDELGRLAHLFARLGPPDQRRVLDSIAIICDWIEPIAAGKRRTRRVG